MGFLSRIWELLSLQLNPTNFKSKIFFSESYQFKKLEKCIMSGRGGAVFAGLRVEGLMHLRTSLCWVLCSEAAAPPPPLPPQPVLSLGTSLPVTYTFLNLMGSFVYYGLPIARMGQGGDEWFIRKAAQGRLHGYDSSTLIRKAKGLLVPGREREGR